MTQMEILHRTCITYTSTLCWCGCGKEGSQLHHHLGGGGFGKECGAASVHQDLHREGLDGPWTLIKPNPKPAVVLRLESEFQMAARKLSFVGMLANVCLRQRTSKCLILGETLCKCNCHMM